MEAAVASYDAKFYEYASSQAYRSASAVVPHIMSLVSPNSVVDVGCGQGTWLAAFRESGVEDILGIDGSWVDQSHLAIPRQYFRSADISGPLRVERSFDLVVSLEVAEHLPGASAVSFVESLTGLGDVVLFSAAIPGQGGEHHVNEQWPSYWSRLFGDVGYVSIDCVRFEFWNNENIAAYYAQNMFLAVRAERLQKYPDLSAWIVEHPDRYGTVSDIAHPRLWASATRHPSDRYAASTLAKALVKRCAGRSRVAMGRVARRLLPSRRVP